MTYSNETPPCDQLIALYTDAGMTDCTAEPEKLLRAVAQSLCVVCAWEEGQLVGLARAVGDGETILYIQDVLVHSGYQHVGIGTQLITMLISAWPRVHSCVLMADGTAASAAFYGSLGFCRAQDSCCTAYLRCQ